MYTHASAVTTAMSKVAPARAQQAQPVQMAQPVMVQVAQPVSAGEQVYFAKVEPVAAPAAQWAGSSMDAKTLGILATCNSFTIRQHIKFTEMVSLGFLPQPNTYT